MKILVFKTNISSPIGIQAVWDALKSLNVSSFNIDFQDVNKILQVAVEGFTPPERIVMVLRQLGYRCEMI
ncbi:hypothetical protein SAMN04515674_101244 [Pseudarcicella hirudinis]|uniref:Uncharacterized protein n=1 Tax=Pseudarcicella hirudinis TaxID=1079859 RepID=A0A1I5MEJ2_9BACT|nr:hypothetical protein [Pseudarcicella hirudinis]SFP07346.1 hypothetical protein SAMN04515674_101244 [Pseudarcicella hirudinis]